MAVALALLAAAAPLRAADLQVSCGGCEPSGENRSLNLLLRRDRSVPITLTWSSATDPGAGKRTLLLYAGNPVQGDALQRRGELGFRSEGGAWKASADFRAEELGGGTFLAVVTSRPRGEGERADGENETIVDWRAFRLLTEEERKRKEAGPKAGSGWSVDVVPALLKAQSGHGDLPRNLGGDPAVWWSLSEAEGNTADLDLDGEDTGLPGIGVQVSSPWHSRAGEDWKAKVLEGLKGVEGHEVHFGGLEWIERPDREVTLSDSRKLFLRSYYTVVTLHTAASVRSFDPKEVGSEVSILLRPFIDPTYFSHETTARLRHPKDPRFWASYSRRELGADRRLLGMLQRQLDDGGRVPGIAGFQRDDGDGGEATYSVGFLAQVRPWDEPGSWFDPRKQRPRAGLVAVDIVAARAGVGGLATHGSGAASSALGRAWCKVVRCGASGDSIDLDRPPDGYDTTQVVASLGTLSGSVPLLQEVPRIAERDVPAAGQPAAPERPILRVDPVALPEKARFAVTAHLRAGALLQKGSWGYVKNVVPIDAYAQLVVKLTVAMFPGAPMVDAGEATIPSDRELQKDILVPVWKGFWAWVMEHALGLGLSAALLAVVVVLALVPGGLGVLRAAVGVVTKLLQAVLEAVGRAIDRMRGRK
jgi:hypothetical protein